MKRIVTLILAAGLILGATSAAQAVDFKVSGLWQHRVSFADRNFEKHNGDDKLRAASRLRTQIDVIASESLKGVMFFEIGHQNWGKAAEGAITKVDDLSKNFWNHNFLILIKQWSLCCCALKQVQH